jgi:hypothetical protein
MGLNAGLTVQVALGTGVCVGEGVGLIVGEQEMAGVAVCAFAFGIIAKANTMNK